jgi:hypothetical protein
MIDDPKIATAYAIEAVRVFDHLQFRDRMRGAFGARSGWPKPLRPNRSRCRSRPRSVAPTRPGFDRFYKPDSQAFRDRAVFST